MIREVCLFDKFSYCKNGVRCLRIHLKEVCQNRECDYRKCNKRHPRPCRIFRMNGFCRFGTSCRYSHRLPKEVEEQNHKIESIEKINAKLSKQIDDQNEEIKKLKSKLLEFESRELKNLQMQINDLVKNNNEKEIVIKKLNSRETNEEEEVELDERADSSGEFQDDKENDEIEVEETELDEAAEAENLQEKENNSDEETDKKVECDYEYSEYLRIKLVEKLRNLKVELSKLRKNSTKQIRSKVKEFNEEMKREKGSVWISYGLRCSLDDLSDLDKKTTDKDEVMKLIEQCIYTHYIVE